MDCSVSNRLCRPSCHLLSYILCASLVFSSCEWGLFGPGGQTQALSIRSQFSGPSRFYFQVRPDQFRPRSQQPSPALNLSSTAFPILSEAEMPSQPTLPTVLSSSIGSVHQNHIETPASLNTDLVVDEDIDENDVRQLVDVKDAEILEDELEQLGGPLPKMSNHQVLSKSVDNEKIVEKRDPIQEEQKRIMIEKYKNLILTQLHLDQAPQLGPSNRSAWDSIPMIIKNRLKSEVDASNSKIDVPTSNDEQKETLILLKLNAFNLKEVSSIAFTLEVAENIDPNHISKATLHVETNQHVKPHSHLTVWEIIPPWFTSRTYWFEQPILYNMNAQQLFQEGESKEEQAQDNGPQISEPYSSSGKYMVHQPNTFKLIKPEIASALVPRDPSMKPTSFDVTARMIQWLKDHKRSQSVSPLVRTVLIVCPKCDQQGMLVDPKKVVLEIRYRPGLMRQRRSVAGSEETLGNTCHPTGHQFSCCTQPLTIKFADIGWGDWILHPKEFEPNYCRGSCQATGFKSLHYDVMNLLLRKNLNQYSNIQRDALQSCCHPTRRTSMSVLYKDAKHEVHMDTLHNLIVLECGCS